MKKFQKTMGKICPLLSQLHEECVEFLKETLADDPTIDLKEFEEDGGMPVCVTYNGGNHPEYASNVFSQVLLIKKDEKGNVVLDTEDAEILIEDVPAIEASGVCEVVVDWLFEQLRGTFSVLLMRNTEGNPLKCNITIDPEESQGLSSLEQPTIKEVFQDEKEGIICFVVEGLEKPMEFDEFDYDVLKDIYAELTSSKRE